MTSIESLSDDWFGAGTVSNRHRLVIAGTSALLFLWAVVDPLYLLSNDSTVPFKPRYLLGFGSTTLACFGIMYATYWLEKSPIDIAQYSNISTYWLAGGLGFLVFNVGLMAFFPADSIWIVLNWIRWALTLGLAVGMVVGISQAQAVSSRISAERQSLRADHVEKQRDLIDQMNGILRHEVLNSTQVITGNAAQLQEETEPIEPTDERIQRIDRHGRELADIIQEVRALLNAVQDYRELQPVNVSSVISSEVAKLEDQYPQATVAVHNSDELYIQADDLVGRVFGNVLRNAAEHNDTSSLRITIDVETEGQSVVATITDTGEGIPDHLHETLFDRPRMSDHGWGLFLVNKLMESYGGELELVETGGDGTVFECRFPTAETAPEKRDGT